MERSDHVINGIVQQRNAAMDNAVNAYADFMVAQERIAALEAEVASLKAELERSVRDAPYVAKE